jgi:hypothetical protein
MSKSKAPVLFLGIIPKRRKPDVVLQALLVAEKLIDSVAYINKEGDTVGPLRQIRAAIKIQSNAK